MNEAAELAIARERIDSLVRTSLDQVLCLEYDPPVPMSLPAAEQAARMLESAVIVLCNDAAALPFSGFAPREVVGRRLVDVIPHASEVFRAQMVEFVLAGYRQHRHLYAFPLRDGGEAWQEINRSGTVVDGKLVRSWNISRDVTEQRHREERLRVSEERLRSYVEQTVDHVWCWTYEPPLPLDLPADELAREQPRRAVLVDCNHAAAAGVGAKSKDDIIGKTYGEIFPANDRVPLLLAEQGYAENEMSDTDATGRTRSYVVRRTQRVVDGCVVQSWATTREVTAAKQAAAALLDSERKLQESRKLASLGVLARGIAHDFSTLLAKVIGHVEVARIAGGSDGGASLDAIQAAVARGLDLVEQIESFTLKRDRTSDAPAPAAASRRSTAPAGGAHVLLVDDEPQLARVAAQALVDLGYRVTTHASPLAALDGFRAAPASFDVVVTDQTMPELHGIELATAISKIRDDVPILLISGYAEIIPPESLRSAGVVASLPKPFPLEELAARIRAALDARTPSGDSA
jgi:PAS domain S-box-containing protein